MLGLLTLLGRILAEDHKWIVRLSSTASATTAKSFLDDLMIIEDSIFLHKMFAI